MKKYVSILLSVLLLLTMLPLGMVSVSAETYGNLTYTVSNGEVTITDCNTSASGALTIPSAIEGYPVTKIGKEAFYYCRSLTAITIPNSVTVIEDWAFWWCSGLTSISIPNSVTTIGSSAFYLCTGLTSITIPDTVTTIGGQAFYKTGYYDSSANWENGVLYMGDCLIVAKTSLSGDYTIREGTRLVADYAFSSCTSLTSVTIPDSVSIVRGNAFSSRTSITVSENNLCYSSVDGVLFDKDKTILIKCPQSKSGHYTIPDGITTIGLSAFDYCFNLTSITVPDSVITIENYAFNACSGLTSVTLGANVASIGESVFAGCYRMVSFTVSADNSSYCLEDGVLFDKAKTRLLCYPAGKKEATYVIPDSVIIVEDHAFDGCTGLTSVIISDAVTSIGSGAFVGCSYLTSVIIGDGVATIDDGAFSGCVSLTSVTIPDSVITIGNGAFQGCFRITKVSIGTNVSSIGDQAFYNCSALTCVIIPDSVITIGEQAFYQCTGMRWVYIGDGTVTIGDSAFYTCTNLTTVTIGDGVTTIGARAFYACNALRWLSLGKSVSKIGSMAMYPLNSLKTVYYRGSEEESESISIHSSNSGFIVKPWVYDCDNPANAFSPYIGHSAMDTEQGTGLAFRFELTADGVATKNGTVADYTNATVNYLGTDCKLVGMGAVITNDDEKGNILHMLRENVNGETMIDVPAVYLYDVGVGSCTFATRIIDIPDTQLERVIYARPYYIVEVDGKQITVYGEIDSASCAEYM